MSEPKRARVVLVDDSRTARAALRFAIEQDPAMQVVGEAEDGPSASRLVFETSPDLVTMDLFLGRENGLDVARRIMEAKPTPIVVVTAADSHDPALVFRAMQAGVLEVVRKLPGPTHPDYERLRREMVRTLRSLSSVPVVRRRPSSPSQRPGAGRAVAGDMLPEGRRISSVPPRPRVQEGAAEGGAAAPCDLVLMGASTGGPPALAQILTALPRPFPVPIALVQHMASGFLQGFATWLSEVSGQPTQIVGAPVPLRPGIVYLADEQHHLVLDGRGRVAGSKAAPRGYHRPSVDVLFESGLLREHSERITAVLLTGMGRDGAQGLLALHAAGAFTIAQLPSSCAVESMPARAIDLGAARAVLSPAQVPAAIRSRLRPSSR